MEEKNEILSVWRGFGFLDGLKKDGIVEWRCAKSFDLMVKYMLSEDNANDEVLQAWGTAAFPIIRRCIAKNANRITRVINPEELIGFLRERTIGKSLQYVYGLKGKTRFKYLVGCFGRYLEDSGKLDDPLINLMTIFKGEKREWVNKIFNCDYEAEVCAFISDYFCSETKNVSK